MADKAKYEVEIEYTSKGASEAEKHADRLIKKIDELSREGEITEKGQRELSKEVQNASDAYNKASKGTQDYARSLPTLRYALYDVARSTAVVASGITAMGTALFVASAQYETAFVAVQRTSGVTGDAVGELRDEFLQLSREIPQTFSEIANIGARGAQLGVATDQLAGFTEVVAQFVATSDTVSLDQAVEAFGRISNLMGDTDFRRIGSSITLVGVNAAATEAQIVKTTEELAPFATAVGMSTDEVIGLAAALGSLGQPPERARSAFLTLQRVMDTAISTGSDNLHSFARLLGITADEVTELWKTDPSQFINAFANALGGVSDLTGAFRELGIHERRAVQVFQALASDARNAGDGVSVLTKAFADANEGYVEGSELARQYGLIVETLASKWQIFLNSVGELASALGDHLVPGLKSVIDFLSGTVQHLTRLTKTTAGKWAFWGVAALAALTAGGFALISMVALATASMAGLATTMIQVRNVTGVTKGRIRGLSGAFREMALQAGFSSRALQGFRIALASTGIGLAVVAIGTLISAFMQASESADEMRDSLLGDTGGLAEALAADQEAYTQALRDGNLEAAQSFQVLKQEFEQVSAASDEGRETVEAAAKVLGVDLPDASGTASDSLERQTAVLGENTLAWMRNALMNSAAFQELASNADFIQVWEEIGADFVEATKIGAAQGVQGVENYFHALINQSNASGSAYLSGFARLMHRVRIVFAAAAKSIAESWRALIRGDFAGVIRAQTTAFSDMMAEIRKPTLIEPLKQMSALTGGVGSLTGSLSGLGGVLGDNSDEWDDWGDSVDRAGSSAGKTANRIRTLVDYASDLSKVWGRAFDIRFSGQETLDTITSQFIKIREESDRVADAIRDLKNDIRSLTSDISIQEYFLGIALEYGDTKRAEAIEAELAKKRAELADKTKQLAEEQDKASKSLEGDSKAAIEHRKTILDLVQAYQSHLQALAASGMSQADLLRESEKLRQEFVRQATEMGYSRDELKTYEAAFTDTARIIRAVPFEVTTDLSSLDPALLAIREFVDDANKSLNSIGSGIPDSLGSSLGGAGGVAEEGGKKLGFNAWGAMYKEIDLHLPEEMPQAIFDGLMSGDMTAHRAAKELGFGSVEAFMREFGHLFPRDVRQRLQSGISSAQGPVRTPAQNLGRATGSNVNSGFSSRLDLSSRTASSLSSGQYSITAAALGVGYLVARNIRSGISSMLTTLLGSGTARQVVRRVTGFEKGGYTGSGGRTQPAGIVHRGEYVIPKRDVNQATGLPTVDALGRLMRRQRGYATGGYVGPTSVGRSVDSVSLSAGTIQQLANVMEKYIVVNGRILGETTSDAFAAGSAVGSN